MNTNFVNSATSNTLIDNTLNSQFNNSNKGNYDELFKTILTIAVYVLKCSYRGFTYLCKDIPTLLWGKVSGSVNQAYQKSKNKNIGPSKVSSLVNMDINDLFKNTALGKAQQKKFEEQKAKLALDLQGQGGIRSKEPKTFRFTAKKDGKVISGTMSGFSKLDINTFLVQDGYEVYSIESNKTIDFVYGQSSIFAVKLKNKDLIFWLTQLSTYLKAGITLTDSVKILNDQMRTKPAYKRAFQSIVYELTMGESFSSALEKQGTMFPPLLVNMLKAAEATGELEKTLDDMANYYNETEKTRKEMKSALTYPAIIMIFAIAVVVFVLVYVIPSFTTIFTQAGTEIKGFTKFVLDVSVNLKANYIKYILFILGSVITIYFMYHKVKAFRRGMQSFLMKIPVIGKLIIYNEMSIFAKTFSSLLKNNVFITESITILSKVTNNEIYKEIMYNCINNVIKGEKISKAFKDKSAVPTLAYFMIVTGESTGQLAEMMGKVSDYYTVEHRSMSSSLKAFIEPITIAVLAIVVGALILAIVIPMFDMMNQVS